MKKLFIYIALSVYVFSQVKPLAIILEDVIAHTLWQAQHMATVHFENGRYHLHTELKDVSEKENKNAQEKAPSSEKSSENTAQNISELNFNFQTNSNLIPAPIHQTQAILAGFTRITSPPPKTV